MTFRNTINVRSNGMHPAFFEVTGMVSGLVGQSGIKNGICVVYSHHTTCSVLTQERSYDTAYNGLEFVQQDLVDALEKIIPACRKEGQYMHPGPKATAFAAENGESKQEALNTDAHLQSSILGRSVTIVVMDGKLDLGEFAQIYFADFDRTRPRDRQIQVQIIGE